MGLHLPLSIKTKLQRTLDFIRHVREIMKWIFLNVFNSASFRKQKPFSKSIVILPTLEKKRQISVLKQSRSEGSRERTNFNEKLFLRRNISSTAPRLTNFHHHRNDKQAIAYIGRVVDQIWIFPRPTMQNASHSLQRDRKSTAWGPVLEPSCARHGESVAKEAGSTWNRRVDFGLCIWS